MLQFYEKRSWRSLLSSTWFIALLGLIVIFLAFVVYDRYLIERDMAARRAATEAELEALRIRQASLTETVEYLQSERGQEAEMRRNFDVAQEGERVVIILDDEASAPATIEPITSPETATPWYIFWRYGILLLLNS